jgi:phosphoenolpyruvate carboxylase
VLEALWQTEEIRERRVGPLQEVANAVFYFDRTIFETAARFYETFDAELAAHYPAVRRRQPFLTFASWVGGDRDGNPFVTPEVSRTTVQWHACTAMDYYERECARLVQELTHAHQGAESVTAPEPPEAVIPFQPYELFRAQLTRLRHRLRTGKAEQEEIIAALETVQKGLLRQGAHRSARGRLQRLRDMYRHWPFFQTLLDNAEVSLAKTDLGIAVEYAGLVRSRAVRERMFGLIRLEYRRSVEMVLQVNQRSRLLESQTVLEQSIQRRNPYVDPLNYLQIRFLGRWRRAGEPQRTETLRRLLALTVNGIAFGMKSTG